MEASEVVSIITTVGFPIAMCLILMWYIMKINECHKTEMETLQSAIDNNTKAIENLEKTLIKSGIGD